jgi:prolipoprotein diacylglyceryltransferase
VGRFFLSFLRVEFKEYGGLNEAQIIALVIIVITVPLLIFKTRVVQPDASRAERRRRAR